MWVSFPISRRVRVIIPWFIAIPLLPVAAAFWVLGFTFEAMGWAWHTFGPPRKRRSSGSGETIRVTIRSS